VSGLMSGRGIHTGQVRRPTHLAGCGLAGRGSWREGGGRGGRGNRPGREVVEEEGEGPGNGD
jgi:hypothetical protein